MKRSLTVLAFMAAPLVFAMPAQAATAEPQAPAATQSASPKNSAQEHRAVAIQEHSQDVAVAQVDESQTATPEEASDEKESTDEKIYVSPQEGNGPFLVTSETPQIHAGQSAWVAPIWSTDCDVKAVSVQVKSDVDGQPRKGKNVKISYPTTRGGRDTSFYQSDSLATKAQDFTAFRIAVPANQQEDFKVQLFATYQGCGEGVHQTSWTLLVPVAKTDFGTEGFKMTEQVQMPVGVNKYKGFKVQADVYDLKNFRAEVVELPEGLEVSYPGEEKTSGLSKSSDLVGNDDDYFAVRLNTKKMTAGEYTLVFRVTYQSDTEKEVYTKVAFNVTKE